MTKKPTRAGAKLLLRAERLQYKWSQQELAERLGTSVVTINRWERGVTTPTPYFRLKLCALFKKSASELGLLPDENMIDLSSTPSQHLSPEPSALPASPSSPPWYLPFRHNPFFTGRGDLLVHMHSVLSTPPGQIYALCGLGGIGKTQLAIEYAYRFRQSYQAILWLRAETYETLLADCRALSRHLTTQDEAQQNSIESIRDWLCIQKQWLLILDNVDTLALVEALLPPFLTGHVLITTRIQATGSLAQHLRLTQMTEEESTLLLLRRARLLAPSALLSSLPKEMRTTAGEIGHLLGGLPLALDQAGAYIEETGCRLSDYLERYHHYRKALLQRRGGDALQHPASVVSTISLCFERVEQMHPAAAELLRCCAFLPANGISQQFLLDAAPELGTVLEQALKNPLEMDAAFASLRTLSLLQRNTTTGRLIIHRLVQAVLRDNMDARTKQQWAEHIVRAVNRTFPATVSPENTHLCEQLLPLLDVCLEFMAHYTLCFPEIGQLLQKAGHYLLFRGYYSRAEGMLNKALTLLQPSLKNEALFQATILNDLGMCYEEQGKYGQADHVYQQVLLLRENVLAEDHPAMIDTQYNAGRLALKRGYYAQAEVLLVRVLSLQEQHPQPEHFNLISTLYLVATLYQQQGRYEQAEIALWRAVSLCQKTLGDTHPLAIEGQSRIAILQNTLGKQKQASKLAAEIVALLTKEHNNVYYQTASSLRNLGLLYSLQEHYRQAETLLRQALAICQRTFGYEHSETAESLRSLGLVYKMQGNYPQAARFLQRAGEVYTRIYGSSHPEVAASLSVLGAVYGLQGDYHQAEEVLLQTIEIFTSIFGPSHPEAVESLSALATIYSLQKKELEARETFLQVLSIQQKLKNGRDVNSSVI